MAGQHTQLLCVARQHHCNTNASLHGAVATQSACAAFVGVFCAGGALETQQCAASFVPTAWCCCLIQESPAATAGLHSLNCAARLLSAVQVPALQQLNMYGCRRASGPQLQVVLDRLPALQWVSLNGCHGITTLHLTRRLHTARRHGCEVVPWVVSGGPEGSGNV